MPAKFGLDSYRTSSSKSGLANDLKEISEQFKATYHQINAAVCLCSGLEIIAANPACSNLFAGVVDQLHSILISDLLQNPTDTETLFGNPGHPVSIRVKGTDQLIKAEADRWRLNANLWLVQWEDQSEINALNAQMKLMRDFDPTTGALSSSAFSREMKSQLKSTKADQGHAILIEISLNLFELPKEARIEAITTIVSQLRTEFGTSLLISKQDNDSLRLWQPKNADEIEERHILRQIKRICTRVGTTPNLYAALFPEHGKTPAELVRSLEVATTAPVLDRKVVVFQQEMLDAELKKKQLAEDMLAAIQQSEIAPHFQPIIDSQSETIKGFEALVRWFHPQLGYIIPPEIISIATQSGLLELLTSHVMNHAIAQMSDWPDFIQFAVNVSPDQLTGNLVDQVRGTIRQHNIDPARLEIEITENALISDFEASANIFARLRAIGVSIAMDDFGAGYTSIGNLRRLEFTKIKIDKVISDGLPHDPRSVAIVRSLMFMARELDVDITVEGIETEEQRDFLRAFNCGIQGYVFSPPVAPSAMSDMRKFLAPNITGPSKTSVIGIGPRKSTVSKKQTTLR